MSERKEGIVAAIFGNKYVIATKEGICEADMDHSLKLGQSVSFLRTNQVEPYQAYEITRKQYPVLEFEETGGDFVLLKVLVYGTQDETWNNRIICNTNFFGEVMAKPGERNVNRFIDKAVFVKYCETKRHSYWEIQHADENNTSADVVGFAYALHTFNRNARVYVPGYKKDLLLQKSRNFNPEDVLGRWVQFTINSNKEVDPTKPITYPQDKFKTRANFMIEMPCSRRQNEISTVYNDSVTDPNSHIDGPHEFQNQLVWLEVLDNFVDKPNFVVHGERRAQPLNHAPEHRYEHLPNNQARGTNNRVSSNRNGRLVSVPSVNRPRYAPVHRNETPLDDEPSHYQQKDRNLKSPPRSPPGPTQKVSPMHGSPPSNLPPTHEHSQYNDHPSRYGNRSNNLMSPYGNNVPFQHAPSTPPPPPQHAMALIEYERAIEQKDEEIRRLRREVEASQQFERVVRQCIQDPLFCEIMQNYDPQSFAYMQYISNSR